MTNPGPMQDRLEQLILEALSEHGESPALGSWIVVAELVDGSIKWFNSPVVDHAGLAGILDTVRRAFLGFGGDEAAPQP
jgi:hypothetical protein